ncbi:MAG TPA: DNA translocase FtsK 4TM domain-containing protein [Kiloniellales bacterium]
MAARSSTINTRSRKATPHLWPSGTGAFVRRRMIELAGVVLAGFGAALAVAGLSFRAGDPSFNRAGDGPAMNLLGLPGAYAADLMWQTLGLAAFLLPLVLIVWGLGICRRRSFERWLLRLTALPVAALLSALAVAYFPTPPGWPSESGVGGFTGALLLGWLSSRLLSETWIVALGGGVLALAALAIVLAVDHADWQRLLRAGAWLGRQAVRLWAVRRRVAARVGDLRSRRAYAAVSRSEPAFGAPRAAAAPRPRTTEKEPPESAETLVTTKRTPVRPGKRGRQAAQGKLDFGAEGDFELPPLSLLAEPPPASERGALSRDALEKNARLLESVLDDFGVKGEIVKIRPGPVVTRYELEPAPGTKTSRVVGLADDIARSMSAISVRVAVVPGSSTIGIELPNNRRETVFLRELLGSEDFECAGGKLPLILGKDISGHPVLVDLARMPHLLIAGTTGSGKSVSINTLALSLLYRLSPDDCKFIMIDPKMLELSVYDGIPHLISPVVTEPKKAVVALKWTVREMEERYRAMTRLGVRNIDGYNARIEEARRTGEVLTRRVQTGFDPDTGQPIYEDQPFDLEPLPFIVVVVDEMADLMLVAGKDIEAAVQRLAQMARAAGIHLLMATQRPSVDVITGTIKANFPTRVSFHVTSKIDSRTILGEPGAEQLLGQGDMLYMAQGGRITRVHGPLVTDQEVEDVVAHLKRQGQPSYIDSVTEDEDAEGLDGFGADGGSGDELYDRAVAVICQHRKASTSFIQRHLQIGYNRAARIIERMEAEGLVSEANHVGKREVLISGPEGMTAAS